MDNFTYNYLNIGSAPSNRLGHVSDAVNASVNTDDIESQNANNYTYDQLGQLISDQQEMIASIEWRSGDKKIKTLTRAANAGNKSDLEFIYNPLGQRILKIEKPRVNNVLQTRNWWKYTYYTYDANGQVMATYEVTLSPALNRAYLKDQNIYGASRIGMRNKYIALYENGTVPYTIPAVQQNTLGTIAYEITNYLGNVNVVISDRKIWTGTPTSAFKACVVSRTDYFPFGMEISSRTLVSDNYKYGYVGLERDNEVSGNGNSYNTEYRQYDPRLGRWKSCDPKRHWFPSMSAYCYASNSPIAGKDDNGLYTIFVNGYIKGKPDVTDPNSGTVISDDILPKKPYWQGNGYSGPPDQFIKAAHEYFKDGMGRFVNGTGSWFGSTAQGRQRMGRKQGKMMAQEIIADILKLNSDENPNNNVTELNFVTHSMGAAFGEGMIEEFMKHPILRKLLEKGQIVHYSACDGDEIKISANSKHLNRSQLNYFNDKTLAKADPGSKDYGGYRIPGVEKFGCVYSAVSVLHPCKTGNLSNHDFHFDSKTYAYTWSFLKALDKKFNDQKSSKAIWLEPSDLNNEDWEEIEDCKD
jgi:RHS repeat-associated protein